MSLEYPEEWKFEGFDPMPQKAHWAFLGLVGKIAAGRSEAKEIYEAFSRAFGGNDHSSTVSWAEDDMRSAMSGSLENAAIYIDAFHTGLEAVESFGVAIPSVKKINTILSEHDVNLMVEPPELKLREGDILLVDEDEVAEELLPRDFIKGEQIGQGGFGTVYRVTRKTKLGEYAYAMKVFDPSALNSNNERAFKRFIRELRLLEQLQHRAIIPLLEAGLNKDQVPYILMPLVDGDDLSVALAQAKSEDVLTCFDEILNALEFAHAKDIFHRDLKPSNIIVRRVDRQPFILDFGAGFRLEDAGENLTTTLVGTDAYVPEEVRTNPQLRTPQQDVYACGKLLYQVIMGSLPRLDDYDSIDETHDGFDGFDEVVKKCISSSRKRYKTITELRASLAALSR